ncbi:MAG: hypothetical protein OXC26_24410 [Albidovulum sp.]|nr:hypothetical protein [Albidovulum sp.]
MKQLAVPSFTVFEELLARVEAFRGKPAKPLEPRTVIARVVATVNVSWKDQVDAYALASALRNGDIEMPQVGSSFIETDLDARRIFAVEFGVPLEALLRSAEASAAQWRCDVPLLSAR